MIWTILFVIISQFFFIFFRTMNVRYVAKGKVAGAMITGGLVNILWIVTTAFGIKAFNELDFITAFAYLAGGQMGVYYGMREKQILEFIQYWMYFFAIDYEVKGGGEMHIIFYRNSYYAVILPGATKKDAIKKFIKDYTDNKIFTQSVKGYFFNLN